MKLAAHRVALALRPGWEGRILRREAAPDGEQTYAVVHLATFPLPEQRGDFGAGVTELMRSPDVLVVLFEYGPESLHSPMFAAQGLPRLRADMFSSTRLQRPLPGQLGCQLFFTEGQRPFCLYVVAGKSRDTCPASSPRSTWCSRAWRSCCDRRRHASSTIASPTHARKRPRRSRNGSLTT